MRMSELMQVSLLPECIVRMVDDPPPGAKDQNPRIRCPSKAPDPEKRPHVEEKLRNAEDRLAYYEREGLVLEAEKMRYLIRNCHLELREMDLMVEYRRDQNRAAQVTFYPRQPKK